MDQVTTPPTLETWMAEIKAARAERDRLRASNAELITACQELEAAISNWRARAHVSKTDEAQAQTRLNMARAQAGAAIAKAKGE